MLVQRHLNLIMNPGNDLEAQTLVWLTARAAYTMPGAFLVTDEVFEEFTREFGAEAEPEVEITREAPAMPEEFRAAMRQCLREHQAEYLDSDDMAKFAWEWMQQHGTTAAAPAPAATVPAFSPPYLDARGDW